MILEPITPYAIALWGVSGIFIITFFIQLDRLLRFRYVVTAFHTETERTHTDDTAPVSVIVVIENEFDYVAQTLPVLLTQEYPLYEVVVVADNVSDELSDELRKLTETSPHLKITSMQRGINIRHFPKLQLNVGIKAARYNHLIITTVDYRPTSSQWLREMASGFDRGDVVIGYAALDKKHGIFAHYMRCTNFCVGMRYLTAAAQGKPYRGTIGNLGFTREVYFANHGFTHLNLLRGIDDLFIQKIVCRGRTAVVVSPSSTVVRNAPNGLAAWREQRNAESYHYRFYPARIKFRNGIEILSRLLFYLSSALLLATGIIKREWLVVEIVGGLWLIHQIVLLMSALRCARQTGEKSLIWFWPWYDWISPMSEICLNLRRRIKPANQIWTN